MNEFDVYAAMQEGKEPVARYKKSIVGQVQVSVLDPFSDKPTYLLLKGVDGDKDSMIDLWTNKQLVFFERMNNSHIKAGRLIKTSTKQAEPVLSPNQVSDEEIDELLSSKIAILREKVETFTETPPILRLLNRARELEKSERVVKYLEEQMAKLELERYG